MFKMLGQDRSGEFVNVQNEEGLSINAPGCDLCVLGILEEGVEFGNEFWDVSAEFHLEGRGCRGLVNVRTTRM